MATLTKQEVTRGGLEVTYGAAASGGDEFVNTGSEHIRIKNDDSSTHTVTIITTATVDGLAVDDRQVSIPAGEERAIGPFPPKVYNNSSSMVQLTYDDVTSVTIAIVTYVEIRQPPQQGGGVIYVPDDYATIGAAIAAPGQYFTVIVRPGTYAENITISKSITVQSESDNPLDTIIDGGQHATKAPVEFLDGGAGYEGPPRLRGFTIRNGRGHDTSGTKYGGGIYCDRTGSMTISNCIIRDNTANAGGGIFFEQAVTPTNPIIMNNVIRNNSAFGSPGSGGGICAQNLSLALRIEGNDIYNNYAAGIGGGAAIWGVGSDKLTMNIINNTINNNVAVTFGGGLYINDTSKHEYFLEKNVISYNKASIGAGVHGTSTLVLSGELPFHFEKCDIYNNIADLDGGGLCLYAEDTLIRNCFLYKNKAGDDGVGKGGAVYTKSDFMGFINSTFYQNTSDDGQAIYIDHDTPANAYIQIVNCILWNDGTGTQGDELAYVGGIPDVNLTVVYTDIQGGTTLGGWNIDVDPEFLSVNSNNYHIDTESPCAGTGKDSGYWNLPDDDYDYEPRPDPYTYLMDMGADEVVST
jgi:hypothetical protein